MSMSEQISKQNNYMKKIDFIIKKLESYGIYNMSDHLITSYIDKYYISSLTLKENYKNIIQELIKSRIAQRRRQILVHSCIYYKFNQNIISDQEYDRLANELLELQMQFPSLSEEAPLSKVFKDWGEYGSTSGFELPFESPKVVERAERILMLNQWYKERY